MLLSHPMIKKAVDFKREQCRCMYSCPLAGNQQLLQESHGWQLQKYPKVMFSKRLNWLKQRRIRNIYEGSIREILQRHCHPFSPQAMSVAHSFPVGDHMFWWILWLKDVESVGDGISRTPGEYCSQTYFGDGKWPESHHAVCTSLAGTQFFAF